ncbi:hypothetical protein MBAV_002401 [Candidatus Magnetobacterium bavaricum]|uniref:Uncharacterized protein n=1 Tax=Candidatus Magnetobacterium bavaricum TaxID=29290 RepID=A0A0F3GTW0_9BACT|nr:hypothetical protein MBAV_002401 [Candidatus Magnetobacterium bavaricum]
MSYLSCSAEFSLFFCSLSLSFWVLLSFWSSCFGWFFNLSESSLIFLSVSS